MLTYTLRIPDPRSHHVEVELQTEATGGAIELWMPAWTPGSYLIREFARNLRDLEASAADGRALAVRRLDKASFAVDAPEGSRVRVRWRAYAFELSVRTSFVDADHALINGASVFLAVKGRERGRIELAIEAPQPWTIATALEPIGERRFTAAGFDALVDGPLLLGSFEVATFAVDSIPHRIALCGGGNADLPRLAADTRRLVETAARMFGGLPYRDYLFVLHTAKDGRGGLEHAGSTVLLFNRFGFTDPKLYEDLLALIAHEHFHAWNVKRLRPAELVAGGLRAEAYTRSLWIAEGVTSYYDELLPCRAGLVTPERFLERLGDEIARYRESPGRLAMSLEEASLTAWTRFYRPDEDTPNSAVSYYQKGALAALLLDLEIRRRTDSRRSLDDVMRAMVERFPEESAGYATEDFERVASEVAGADLAAFFAHAVRGRGELDLEAALAWVGVALEPCPRIPAPLPRDLCGLRLRAGQLVVDHVERGSSAERAGISPRDEVVAFGGFRAQAATIADRMREAAGASREIVVFRDDRLVALALEVHAPAPTLKAVARDADQGERRRRAAWLGTPA